MKALTLILCVFSITLAQPSRERWGAPAITVSHSGSKWTIAGKRTTVTLNEADLGIHVQAGSTGWDLKPSTEHDMLVKINRPNRATGTEFFLSLADAGKKTFERYDTGFKNGVKIFLQGWKRVGNSHSLTELSLFLTICLEGKNEELVFDVVAQEHGADIVKLDWPGPLDASDVDYTLLSNGRGTILPRHWPKEYYPIRTITPEGKIASTDHSLLQSHVIESWSMSWWGFQKRNSALMVIVETPDDAAYQFSHPAGGPTVIGPRWRAQLGRFAYLRTARVCFFPNGNYVDMAKRYRRYARDTGLFVSLQEKIARTPNVANLIGTPQTRVRILQNLKTDSDRYVPKDPAQNYSLTTF